MPDVTEEYLLKKGLEKLIELFNDEDFVNKLKKEGSKRGSLDPYKITLSYNPEKDSFEVHEGYKSGGKYGTFDTIRLEAYKDAGKLKVYIELGWSPHALVGGAYIGMEEGGEIYIHKGIINEKILESLAKYIYDKLFIRIKYV